MSGLVKSDVRQMRGKPETRNGMMRDKPDHPKPSTETIGWQMLDRKRDTFKTLEDVEPETHIASEGYDMMCAKPPTPNV